MATKAKAKKKSWWDEAKPRDVYRIAASWWRAAKAIARSDDRKPPTELFDNAAQWQQTGEQLIVAMARLGIDPMPVWELHLALQRRMLTPIVSLMRDKDDREKIDEPFWTELERLIDRCGLCLLLLYYKAGGPAAGESPTAASMSHDALEWCYAKREDEGLSSRKILKLILDPSGEFQSRFPGQMVSSHDTVNRYINEYAATLEG